jgi:hypothetical protein
MNMVEYYVLMYENGKTRPIETVLRMREEENIGGSDFNKDSL